MFSRLLLTTTYARTNTEHDVWLQSDLVSNVGRTNTGMLLGATVTHILFLTVSSFPRYLPLDGSQRHKVVEMKWEHGEV